VTVNPIVDGIESVREATLAAQRSVVEAIEAKDAQGAERATRALIGMAAEEVGRAFALDRSGENPPIGASA
jgi:DNA-binding GntR family transcriptional regulator